MTFISYHQIELIWVPRRHGIRGKEKVDEYAEHRSSLDEEVLTPLFTAPTGINDFVPDGLQLILLQYRRCFGLLGHIRVLEHCCLSCEVLTPLAVEISRIDYDGCLNIWVILDVILRMCEITNSTKFLSLGLHE